jgi:MraZ protein
MFTGEFEYRLDDKGRVPIPPKFRTEELKKEGLVLCPGIEKCITLYPMFQWKKLADSLTSGPIIPAKLRKLNRALFATAFNTELDGQGRIMVPGNLRQYAGLNDAVVITGNNAYLELWSKEGWEEEKSNDQAAIFQIIETMEQR